ncbi:putative Glycogen synthase kinase-3 beta [Blattamonas nauphoetae]|uniref:Glycogen synthase kinase-3 beta n=1 Tax=Blattamonas nauphoetae TaxID=2049346 RepID=A0ABQ9YF90_9EUKA|nr:putative Glycogen synthase kinase-3 beta [Blattamonas nauphoetae]
MSTSKNQKANKPQRHSVESIKYALSSCDDDELPQSFDTSVIHFKNHTPVGVGTFGEVFQAQFPGSDEIVAVKKVMQDHHFRNRELQIMKVLDHPNCVKMKQFFVSKEAGSRRTFLHIVMEYVPATLAYVNKRYVRAGQHVPLDQIRMYSYQLLRSCAFIHGYGIVHRDLKPQNVLVNPQTGELKLCDFGSAKVILEGEASICYICSRYYRAPELVFGARYYDTTSDLWGIGCIIAELLLGRPLFPGESNDDQMKKIVQIMGIPTKEEMRDMKAEYRCPFSNVTPVTLKQALPPNLDPLCLDLLEKLLTYSPKGRLTAFKALNHPFFDCLTDVIPPETQAEEGVKQKHVYTAPFFNFTPIEVEMYGTLCQDIWKNHKSRFPAPIAPAVPEQPQKPTSPKVPARPANTKSVGPAVRLTAAVPHPKMKRRALGITLPAQGAEQSGTSQSPLVVPPNTAVASRSQPISPLVQFPAPNQFPSVSPTGTFSSFFPSFENATAAATFPTASFGHKQEQQKGNEE